MISVSVVILEGFACLGLGFLMLRGTGAMGELNISQRLTWAFALGFGVLGWVLFFFGFTDNLRPWPIGVFLTAAASLNVFWYRDLVQDGRKPLGALLSRLDIVLVCLLVIVLGLDVFEALAPPTDADSLAYHFALPKQFLAAGSLEFVARAIDGAVPMLVQMTYVPALALGGESALTLWVMVTGWAAAAMLFSIARPHLSLSWVLVAVLVFLTTPAVQYGAGSGQVEVRISLFVMVAAAAVAKAIDKDSLKFAAIAGLAVGFYMAGKYLGLIFALSCGLVILFQRRLVLHGLCITAAALIAGSQWYIWNWVNTGDPVFPMLFDWLKDIVDYRYWDMAHAKILEAVYFDTQVVIPRNPLGALVYPFAATFYGPPLLQSGRTGLGPYGALLAPFVFWGLWKRRSLIKSSPLFPIAVVVTLFFFIWFFSGTSQVVRHLLPVYPLFLVCAIAAAVRGGDTQFVKSALVGCACLTIIIQLGGAIVFNRDFVSFAVSGENHDSYLRRKIGHYPAALWLNENLEFGDRVLIVDRQIVYYLDIPYFLAHSYLQAIIDVSPETASVDSLKHELGDNGITHVLAGWLPSGDTKRTAPPFRGLVEAGCARIDHTIFGSAISSRTFAPWQSHRDSERVVLTVNWRAC